MRKSAIVCEYQVSGVTLTLVHLVKHRCYRWRCVARWFSGVVLLGEAGGFNMGRQSNSVRSLARRFIACRTTINVLQHLRRFDSI